MGVLSKRLQTGMFEALASSNRAAGSGGGSGLQVLQPASTTTTGVINQTTTSTTNVDVASSSATIVLPRTMYVRVEATIQLAVTAGADFFYVKINVDGTDYYPAAFTGDGPKGYTTQTVLAVPLLSTGTHTIKLTCLVGAGATTGKVVQASIWSYLLGF